MYRFLLAVSVFCLFQYSNAYCCFRGPWTSTCGCSDYDTPCGVTMCPRTNPCGQTVYTGYSFCDCGLPSCSSYRDTCNVCRVCDNPSPVCSCLNSLTDFGCGCNGRSFVYFPEVEYPVVAIEMKPFYYSTCWSY